MLQRRTFIRNLALISAAAAIKSDAFATVASSLLGSNRGSAPAEALNHAVFARLGGATFTVNNASAPAQSIVLTGVTRFDRGPGIENFSVHFEGRADVALAQGTHRFAHPALGKFDLFVTARPLDARTCAYEAVFNRLV